MSRASQGLAADNSTLTVQDITITYTTDDPGTVADGAITIADGDATAGMAAALDEIENSINKINAVLRASGLARNA